MPRIMIITIAITSAQMLFLLVIFLVYSNLFNGHGVLGGVGEVASYIMDASKDSVGTGAGGVRP